MARKYTDLITSAHNDKPRFVETVELATSALAQGQDFLNSLPADFDVDSAVGVQLDAIGVWVGRSRYLQLPLSDVYFEFENPKAGWDDGIWKQEFDTESQLTALDDSTYRKVLMVKIAANSWDGTLPELYNAIGEVFAGKYNIAVVDNQNMTLGVYLAGEKLTKLDRALLVGGYLTLKPVGVRIDEISIAPQGGRLFAWDVDNAVFGGFDEASWVENLIA